MKRYRNLSQFSTIFPYIIKMASSGMTKSEVICFKKSDDIFGRPIKNSMRHILSRDKFQIFSN